MQEVSRIKGSSGMRMKGDSERTEYGSENIERIVDETVGND
jgi:hypothetical protein